VNKEILSQLRDIHWSTPATIWPLAFGYYVVLIPLILCAIAMLYFFVFKQKSRRLKKEIMHEFLIIESCFAQDSDVANLQCSLNALLRRIVFLKRPEEFERSSDLDRMNSTLIDIFPRRKMTAQLIELLKKDRFHKDPDVDGMLLLNLVREQIKRCRI
jgi:hypothetical protein